MVIQPIAGANLEPIPLTGCANNAWWDRLLDCINRRDLWRANIAAGIKIFSVSTLLPQAVVIPLVGMSDG
ncbi:hypothetical protein DM464_07030 [Salmonella enterica subsp. enterica]|nr:hypothetical protein DM464_07030 [Salmonella enterica subsp. enterica]